MEFNSDFLTKGCRWAVHLQESRAIAIHKADEFKQSPLKPVSGFRESNFLYLLQVYKKKKKEKTTHQGHLSYSSCCLSILVASF